MGDTKQEEATKTVGDFSQTFGAKLVGYQFNPSGDDKVAQAKKLFADVANLVNDEHDEAIRLGTGTALREQLFNHAIGEILNAQMNAVKLLTLKY